MISTNQAFKNYRRKEEDEKPEPYYEEIEVPESFLYTPQVTPQVETEIIEKIVEVPVEVIKEVEKIIEVPIEVVKEVPVDRLVEIIREVPVEKIIEVPVEVPFKYYVDDKGQTYDEDGNQLENRLFEKKLDELERKILKYKK